MNTSISCFMTLIRQSVLCSMTLITLTRLTVSGNGIGIPEYVLQWVSNTSWVSDSNYPIHLAVNTMIAPIRLVVDGNATTNTSYCRCQRYVLWSMAMIAPVRLTVEVNGGFSTSCSGGDTSDS